MMQGLTQLSYDLGRIIDPVGHARDDQRRAKLAQTMRNCPRCFAEPGQQCVTVSGNPAQKSHTSR